MSQTINSDNLNRAIEFDSPFTVMEGGNILTPLHSIYVPYIEHDAKLDYLVDGVDPIDSKWQAFSGGYTGQYGYNGPVMHASEQLRGYLAEDILNTPGTYVVCVVEVNCDIEEPECYDSAYDRATTGCDCDPAGWIVLKMV